VTQNKRWEMFGLILNPIGTLLPKLTILAKSLQAVSDLHFYIECCGFKYGGAAYFVSVNV
jgi:hypothetical protein